MRIIIDMQACQNDSRFRGIGRYSTGIITAFLKQAQPKHECILLFNALFEDNISQLLSLYSQYVDAKNLHIWHGLGPTEARNTNNQDNKKISVLLREKYIEKLAPDIVFMPTFFEGFGDNTVLSMPKNRHYQIFATTHDLIPLVQKSLYLDPQPVFKEYYLDQVKTFKTADGFCAVSEASKRELIEYLNVDESKVISTSEGIEEQFKNSHPSVQKINKILGTDIKDRKMILYFGASDERKNHLKLIKAYSLLSPQKRKKSVLVLAGILNDHHLDKFKSYAERCGLSRTDYIFLKRVTDKEVIDLYSACYLFVFPSFHEGFGLPALEAMACGTAVITANTTSLPEVIGRKDLTFDPYNSIELKKYLEKFIDNKSYRDEIAKYCLEHSKQFSWEKSAQSILDFMQKKYIPSTAPTRDLNELQNECIQAIKKLRITSHLSDEAKEKLTYAVIKNYREARKPRIYYDISKMMTVEFHTGIQRVTTEIFNQLAVHYTHRYEIIPVKISEHGRYLEEVKNVNLVNIQKHRNQDSDLNDIRPGDLYLSVDLDHAVSLKPEAFEFLRRQGCKTHFVIHDLLPLDLGDNFFSPDSAIAHYNWLNEIAKSNALICVSQSVMQHANYYLNAIPNVNSDLKLGWFHLGANFSNTSANSASSIKKFKDIDFEHPVFFMVGSVEPRKGHLEVIEAMTELWDNGYKGSLVIAGARGWNNELVVEITNASQYKDKRLFWPQKVSDDDLAYLYSKSTALIAASLGEGFGLPIIEAMQHNIGVIARDIPVFKEVTHGTATYFKTTEQLQEVLLSYEKPTEVTVTAFQNWKQSTQQLMSVIENNQYPIEWQRDEKLRIFPLYTGRFDTTAGLRKSDRICSNNTAGLLLWGGYFPLDEGQYTLNILGKSYIDQSVTIKVISLIDDEIVEFAVYPKLQLNSQRSIYDAPELLTSVQFTLSKKLEEVEVYVEVDEENDLYLSSLEIIQLDDSDLDTHPMDAMTLQKSS